MGAQWRLAVVLDQAQQPWAVDVVANRSRRNSYRYLLETKLLRRYFVMAFLALLLAVVVLTALISLAGHSLLIGLALALIWSLCLQIGAWGIAYVLFPTQAVQFQEKLRNAYPPPLQQMGREFDRSLGFQLDPKKPAIGRARLLGAVVVTLMLSAGALSSWILVASLDH